MVVEGKEERKADDLIERARVELALNRAVPAEAFLRDAYEVLYKILTPLHFKIIDVLEKLSESMEIQGKKRESADLKTFIKEMSVNNKDILSGANKSGQEKKKARTLYACPDLAPIDE